MQTIKINEQHKYDVNIGNDIFENIIKEQFANYEQIAFFIDDKVNVNQQIISKYPKYSFAVKESKKNLVEYEKIVNFLLENNINRKNSLIVAIGGGVTLDLVGYAASTYKRGVDVIYVPTSLLAMVDVAVGSKNTINIGNTKNAVGTFYSPKQVIIDIDFLKTLDRRNYNNGMAEIIKHGAIKDLAIIETILNNEYTILDLVIRSVKVKKYFIERDNFDFGIRQSLNFGHTYGHAIEAYYNYEKYLHGEAVSIGMNLMYQDERLFNACKLFDLPTTIDLDLAKLMPFLMNDKKNTNNNINFITLKKLGEIDYELKSQAF